MIVFKSKKKNTLKTIIRKWTISALIFCIMAFVVNWFFPEFIQHRSPWYFIISIFLLSHFIDLAQEDYINEITIDEENRKIIFQYYDINRGQTEITLDFETTRLRIDKKKSGSTIHFFNERSEIMFVSKSKDGFTTETLSALQRLLESITSSIDKKPTLSTAT